MPYTLKNLIKASGYAGVAGQSFRNHVAGAATGAKVSDYKCTAWVFGGTEPSTSPLGGSYANGESFPLTVTFTQNSRASNIRRTGAAIALDAMIGSNPDGYSAVLSTNSVVSTVSGTTVTVVVTAPLSTTPSGSIVLGSSWFRDYPSPSTPPSGAGAQPVVMPLGIANAGGGTQVRNIQFTLSYAPDTGPFNATLTKLYSGIPFTTRADSFSDFEYEWHSNNTYTNLLYTVSSLVVSSSPLSVFSYWVRYRRIGAPGWSNLGEHRWEDPRFS